MTKPIESRLGEWPPTVLAFVPDEKMLDAAYDAYEKWMDSWWKAQGESLRFCRSCLTRNLEATANLAASTDPVEALDVQMRYVGASLGDAFNEVMRMFVLAGEATMPALMTPTSSQKHPIAH